MFSRVDMLGAVRRGQKGWFLAIACQEQENAAGIVQQMVSVENMNSTKTNNSTNKGREEITITESMALAKKNKDEKES